jgi:hypothetical protein
VNYLHAHFAANGSFLLGCVLTRRNLLHWGVIMLLSGLVVAVTVWKRAVPRMDGLRGFTAALFPSGPFFFCPPPPLRRIGSR